MQLQVPENRWLLDFIEISWRAITVIVLQALFFSLEQLFMQVRDYSVFLFCFVFIVDFAVVAQINEKDKNETEDDGKSKEKKK